MRKILALIWLNLTQIRHDRGAILSMTLLPIMLTALLGVMFGGQGTGQSRLPVGFVDKDRSVYSKRVESLLKREKGYEVQVLSAAAAEKKVANNDLAAVVIVPAGFGASIEASNAGAASGSWRQIELVKGSDPVRFLAIQEVVRGMATRLSVDKTTAEVVLKLLAGARAQFLQMPLGALPGFAPSAATPSRVASVPVQNLPAAVRAAIASSVPGLTETPPIATLVAAADKKWDPLPVSVKLTAVKASSARGDSIIATGYNQYSLGMTIWFVLMLVLGNAESLLEERENGTLPRLLTTPSPRAQVLGGKVAGVYSVGIVQAAILITFGALVFNVDWGTNPIATGLLIGTFTLAATGLAIMVSAVARTRSQAAGLGPVLAVSLSMLGGCVWPIEIVPPFMKVIALFTPTGWAMAGLTDVVVRNQGLQAAILPSFVLLGFSAVFFLVGLTRFRWE
jgi:ABC-2 type transport system permease protein